MGETNPLPPSARTARVVWAVAWRWSLPALPFCIAIAALLHFSGIGGAVDRAAQGIALFGFAAGLLLAVSLPALQLGPHLRRLDYARLRGPEAFAEQADALGRRLLRYPHRFGTAMGIGLALFVAAAVPLAAWVSGGGRTLVAGLLPAGLVAAAVAGRIGRVSTRRALRPLLAWLPHPFASADRPPASLAARLADVQVIPLALAVVAGLVLQPMVGPASREAALAELHAETARLLAAWPPQDLPPLSPHPTGNGAAYQASCLDPPAGPATHACRRLRQAPPGTTTTWTDRSRGLGFAAASLPTPTPHPGLALVWFPLDAPVVATPGLVALLALLVLLAHLLGVLFGRDLGAAFLAAAERLRDARHAQPPPASPLPSPPVDEIRRIQALVDEVAQGVRNLHRSEEEALAELEEAQRLRTQFLASISHDIKGPLNSVLGFSELLLKGMEGPLLPQQRDKVRMIFESGERLLHVINAILDAAKIEAGRLELHREWVPSVELVSRAAKHARSLAAPRRIGFREETQPGLPPVFVDPERIEQSLAALVSNAVKFTEQGTVTLRVRLDEGDERRLRFEVEDQGPGIPPDERHRVFRAFELVDDTTARRADGTGLGLFIARSLVELHGGTLDVRSTPGRGSVFTLLLPLEPLPQRSTPLGRIKLTR